MVIDITSENGPSESGWCRSNFFILKYAVDDNNFLCETKQEVCVRMGDCH